jgi:hypothetical protein
MLRNLHRQTTPPHRHRLIPPVFARAPTYAATHPLNRHRATIRKSRNNHHSCLSVAPHRKNGIAPHHETRTPKKSILSFNAGHNFRAFEFIQVLSHGFVSIIMRHSFTLP